MVQGTQGPQPVWPNTLPSTSVKMEKPSGAKYPRVSTATHATSSGAAQAEEGEHEELRGGVEQQLDRRAGEAHDRADEPAREG